MVDEFTTTINSLGARGDGIGTHDQLPVYVAMALPDETVKVRLRERRKNGLYADLIEVVEASPHRYQPACSHFGVCGGCQLQHLDSQLYQNWGKDRVRAALSQHGFEAVPVDKPFMTAPASRRRIALKALKTASGLVLGYNEAGSHQIVDLVECPVMLVELQALLPELRTLLADILQPKNLASIHLTATDSGLDVLFDASTSIDLAAREKLAAFASKHDIAALHWQHDGLLDPVAIRREPTMTFAGARVPLQPGAFVQASRSCEQVMIEAVVKACAGLGRVADLFCGIGTFTFPLSHHHQVLAVEGALGAITALEQGRNMAQAQGTRLKQIVAKHRDLYRRPLSPKELAGFDAVVIDPPRAGAQAQMTELVKSPVQKVVSVSCNPNTFARDARILADGGYHLEKILPIDQFLWSAHLELIGVFSRK